MTSYANSQYSTRPYCCAVARSFLCLIFFLPPSWPNEILSISQQSHPIRPLPCLCPWSPSQTLGWCLSGQGQSCIYSWYLHTFTHTTIHTHTCTWPAIHGLLDASHSQGRYFTKHHKTMITSASSEIFAILITIPKLKLENISKLQTALL